MANESLSSAGSSDRPAPRPPAPVWLVRLAAASGALAALALCVALWAKWGVVLAMSEDFLKNCF